MRIRKRKVPFPISSLSPIPISDPLFAHPPVVQLQVHHQNLLSDSDTDDYYDPKPSAKSTADGNPHRDSYDDAVASTSKQGKGVVWLDRCAADETRNFSREENSNNIGALVGNLTLHPDSNVTTRQGKKVSNKTGKKIDDRDRQKKKKMITMGEKEATGENGRSAIVDNPSTSNGKKGSCLMEGSRCSRVNGRGWRCWQQTLVGYSLCEHHLGKGRLRNMNNSHSKSKIEDDLPSSDDHGKERLQFWTQADDKEQVSMTSRRKMKLSATKT